MIQIFKYLKEQRAHQRTIFLTVMITLIVLKLTMLAKFTLGFLAIPIIIYILLPHVEGIVKRILKEVNTFK